LRAIQQQAKGVQYIASQENPGFVRGGDDLDRLERPVMNP
jgi:hypothetical protein